MNSRFLSLLLSVIVLFTGLTVGCVIPINASSSEIANEKVYCNATINDNFAPDSLLVVINNQSSLKFKAYSKIDFSNINAKNVSHITEYSENKARSAVKSIEDTVFHKKTFIAVKDIDLSTYKQVLYVELEDSGKDRVLNAIKILEKREDIFYVGPDYYLESYSNTSSVNDPQYFEDHWAYSQIKLDEALDEINISTSEVLVGILDSGIDGDHPELSGRIHNSLNYDFAFASNDDSDDDPLVDDDHYQNHGTKVAGIISGICEDAKLVSLKILKGVREENGYTYTGEFKSSYACRAIEYAGANGIKILNMSLGWHGSSIDGEFQDEDNHYNEAMSAVISQYSGLLIIAAGNDTHNIDDNDLQWDLFPQQLTNNNIVVVAASDKNEDGEDIRKNNSNIGVESVDIFAPGVDIPTTISGGTRGTMSGTSAAAPIVSGVVALMLSYDPEISIQELKNFIMDSADKDNDDINNSINDMCVSGGRIDAYQAMREVKKPCTHVVYEYWMNNTTYHNKVCRRCEYTVLEPHTWIQSGVYRCIVCGDTSTSRPPIVVGSLPNEEDILIALLPVNDEEYLT